MLDTIHVTAAVRIHSSPERVREQYRDIDHHIRNDVHPSIHYEWLPGEPGERKIKTTFRILGVPQYDVSLLEDAPDGSFVIRYLEGTNAGMVLVHRFVEIEPGTTEVQLSADAPSTLGRKLLGPLFVVGARQVMKKALAEDKRDLEQGQFPIWRQAFEPSNPSLQATDTFLEIAYLSLIHPRWEGQRSHRGILGAITMISVAGSTLTAGMGRTRR